jgi:site-specific recombinase XerD
MTPATVRKLITRAGEKAKLPFPIHPHMLRHSTGYKLANDGHDTRAIQQYLGPPQHHAHRALHRAQPGAVQGVLEGLKTGILSTTSLR